jgi:hypothetical protein
LLPEVGASRRLDCLGDWVNARDALDRRLIADYLAGAGPRNDSDDCTGRTCIPQSEIDSVEGRFPILASGAACADIDHDGMPDVWEAAQGLNPADPSDGPELRGDGYTNLERYLNGR